MERKYIAKLLCFGILATSLVQGQRPPFEEVKKNYTEAAKECLKMDPPKAAVFIKKSKPLKFECVTLLEQSSDFTGNCSNYEWLILKKDRLWGWKPQCSDRPCGGSVPVRRVPFARLGGECKDLGDPEPCNKDEVVRHTIHGYGVCSRKRYEDEFANISSNNDVTDSFSSGGIEHVQQNCVTDGQGNCVEEVIIVIESEEVDLSIFDF